MSEHADAFAVCERCQMPIYFGNAQVTVTRNVEQVDRPGDYPEGQITVIESEPLLTLCAQCGNRFDSAQVRGLLRSALPSR